MARLRELGLTMMFHAKIPTRFWLECFSTAVFLLNRLLSPTLGMDSPFYRLNGKHPDYGTIRILGSRCFPYLGDYRQHKLEPKSLPCVFLGYSSKHKGYKCLYPPTDCIYISRHVVFDESILPYSQPTCLCGHDVLLTTVAFRNTYPNQPYTSHALHALSWLKRAI